MKTPYAVFAQDKDVVKFIRVVSGRFARANRAALAENYLPGVFFSHFREEGERKVPVGERHRPVRMNQAPVVQTGYNRDAGRTIIDGTVKHPPLKLGKGFKRAEDQIPAGLVRND